MMKPKEAISLNHRKDYTTDERTGILYKRIGDFYFPVGNRFGIADDGDEEIEQMLRAASNHAGSGAFLGRFAQAHRKYLKESRKSLYASLRASGRLGSCLADPDSVRSDGPAGGRHGAAQSRRSTGMAPPNGEHPQSRGRDCKR